MACSSVLQSCQEILVQYQPHPRSHRLHWSTNCATVYAMPLTRLKLTTEQITRQLQGAQCHRIRGEHEFLGISVLHAKQPPTSFISINFQHIPTTTTIPIAYWKTILGYSLLLIDKVYGFASRWQALTCEMQSGTTIFILNPAGSGSWLSVEFWPHRHFLGPEVCFLCATDIQYRRWSRARKMCSESARGGALWRRNSYTSYSQAQIDNELHQRSHIPLGPMNRWHLVSSIS